jgi:hypothetical protein
LDGFQKFDLAVWVCLDDAALADQSHYEADGEGAATEAEAVDLVSGLIVAADERVDVADILPDADAKSSAERRQRLEVLGTDAIIVMNDLFANGRGYWRLDVNRLLHSPHVRFERARRPVPGTIGQKDNVLYHSSPHLPQSVARLLSTCNREPNCAVDRDEPG